MRWITARNLDTWGSALQARTLLPTLVGDLILASVSEISHFRFPGGDKGQVRGFDGVVEVNADSPFIPNGRSIWEFGVSGDATAKADKDYKKRTKEVSEEDRKNLTFVFVTVRTWDNPQKKLDAWVAEKAKLAEWSGVKYIDGAQLETWLDTHPSVAAQWAATVLGAALQTGVMSTDEFWTDYSTRFDVPLTEEVLLCDREQRADDLIQFLMSGTGRYPLVADSTDEVVAFVVAAIRKADPLQKAYLEARTLIVDSLAPIRFLATRPDTIFLPRGPAIAQAPVLARTGRTVVPMVRDQSGAREIQLGRPTIRSLAKALETMDYPPAKAVELARACGRSVTILMRRIPAVEAQAPRWAELGRALVAAMLAGGWSDKVVSDLDRLEELNDNVAFSELAKTLTPLAAENDPFIEREREIWRTRSPVDAFVQLGKHLTREDFDRLAKVATIVFSEVETRPDPDAPFSERLATSRLSNSTWLREGLATTLLQIAVLHQEAALHIPDATPREYVDGLVGGLPGLKDDPRVMEALRNDLLLLAEAAPVPFLAALEQLLEGTEPKALAFFRESEDVFGRAGSHSNILWSLEILAWDPTFLLRVTLALAKLAAIDPGGRLANRPSSTLLWLPPVMQEVSDPMCE